MFKSHQLYSTAANITRKFLSNNNRTTTFLLTATDGTITTGGDKKIHTFTSPGTFVVSSGSGNVDIVAIGAGGGGGGAGGPGIVIIAYPS